MKNELTLPLIAILLSLWSFYLALAQQNNLYIFCYLIVSLGCAITGKILMERINN